MSGDFIESINETPQQLKYFHFFETRIPKVVDEYKLPVRLVGSPVFGGPKHDTLFVTTGTKPINFYVSGYGVDNTRHTAPAGNLFKIAGLNARGIRAYRPVV